MGRTEFFRLLLTLLPATLLFTPCADAAATWGDYAHRVLLPEERSGPVRLYRLLSLGGRSTERQDSGGRRTDWTDRSAAGIWAAGSLGGRVEYFAEGLFLIEKERFEAGPARIDIAVAGRALSIRAGRFRFPFGIEARGAPHPVNRTITRPRFRSRPESAGGLFGEIGEGALNYYIALSSAPGSGFAGGLADSVLGVPPPGGEEDYGDRVSGGRIGLSPRRGLEFGASIARQGGGDRDHSVGGFDFSLQSGPLLLTAEWGRVRRGSGGTAEEGDIAYGRLSHRIIEYSENFEAVELLAGFDYLDPERGVSGDRALDVIGGLVLSPREGVALKMEYRLHDRYGRRHDQVLAEILLFW